MADVSIIVPVYNTADYLDECVKSLLDQTYKNIEIILVDDGSTDGISSGMCDNYGAADSRVIVIHKTNGGLMSAWIAGVEKATSKYLCFVDGDDWVEPEMVEKLYIKVANKDDIKDIVSSSYIIEKTGESKKMDSGLPAGIYEKEELLEIQKKLLGEEVRPIIMSRCMKLIDNRLIRDNIKYCNPDIRMAEDVNIILPAILDCDRVTILDNAYFYHYRLVSTSIVHKYNSGLLSNIELNYKTFLDIFKEKGIANGEYQMNREFVQMLFIEMKNELRGGWQGCIERVKGVFKREDIATRIHETPLEISSKANKLLYMCMKKPNMLNIAISYLVLRLYDMKTN
ncbi:MAG: glycosyltransferase [Butyrivibrio sp.]|nr:glycosyltransferase [Butyrivibrio sp.]